MTHRRHVLLVSSFLLALLSLANAFAQNTPVDEGVFSFTQNEQRWLAEHPVIRIAPDPSFAPIEWFNQQGAYNGITADYVALLEQKLGVRFEVIQGENWSDILAMAKAREVDALSAVIRTAQREEYLAFSKPYFFSTRAIFSNQNLSNIETVEDLKGYKVAVVKDSWMDERLSQQTDMSLNRFQDLSTALIATSRGVTDVTASALETTRYIRSREGLLDLAIVSELPEQIELSIGVRNDWRPLVGILNKALASISAEETAAIRSKWLELEEPYFWEKPVYRYTALAMVAMLITALIIILTWNRMLNARVQLRGAQLEAAQLHLMRAAWWNGHLHSSQRMKTRSLIFVIQYIWRYSTHCMRLCQNKRVKCLHPRYLQLYINPKNNWLNLAWGQSQAEPFC